MKRKIKEIKPVPYPLLAWKYECPICELIVYSFESYQPTQATCGHHGLGRATRVISFQKKFMEYCSVCNQSAHIHKGKRRDEMFYEAICPTKEK